MSRPQIKPNLEKVGEAEAREAQRAAFRRNLVIGVLIVMLALLVWRLFHTNLAWVFGPGWWRL
jgi:uncharacterized membrane protein YdbT with pleckstrin-like domain